MERVTDMSIKIGIMGYGNLGRGVEIAVNAAPDMELAAVFTRREYCFSKAFIFFTFYKPCVKYALNLFKKNFDLFYFFILRR